MNKRKFLILLLLIICKSSIGQTKNTIDSSLFNTYQYNCGLSCYETIILKKNFTYEYWIWGDSINYKGSYKIINNQVKLNPSKIGDIYTKKISPLTIDNSNKDRIDLVVKRRVSFFRKKYVRYLKQ